MINELFISKCKEVFEEQNKKEILDEQISALQSIMGRDVIEEYRYILNNYSSVFLREKYGLCSKYKSPMADEKGEEPFLYFIGLEGKDNIFLTYEMYKEQLPNSYFPIALADGGNVICISNNSEYIYLWIHDDIKNKPYKIFDSIEEMIMMIKKYDYEEKEIGVISENVVLSEEFFAALNALKNKK